MPSRTAHSGDSKVGRRPALFVDRDGTLNVDLHYLSDPERLELFRGVGQGLELAHAHGFTVVCITNQSGIGRGLYRTEDVERIHAELNERLPPHGRVDAFYYCPHRPDERCDCRKPGVALFRRAEQELGLDLARSAIIGDRGLDIAAGQRLGLITALVPAPNHEHDAADEPWASAVPEIVARSFLLAVARVLARG